MPTRRSLLSNVAGLALLGGGLWLLREHVLLPAPKVEGSEGVTASGWLPFANPRQPLVTVAAVMDGRPVTALVDSGAQISVVDASLAEAGGISVPVITSGLAGGARLGRTARVDVALGALTLEGLGAAVLDLGHVAALGEGRFDAILGDNVFSELVADIDFPRRRIAFHRPETYRLPAGASPVPVRVADRRLMVQVELGGRALEVALDTGASAPLALSRPVAEEFGLLEGRALTHIPSLTLGGVTRGALVMAEEMRFAGEVYRRAPVQLYDGGSSALLPDGLLGFGALSRFRTIIDRGGGRLWIVRPPVLEISRRR